jgi:hypothetical protein
VRACLGGHAQECHVGRAPLSNSRSASSACTCAATILTPSTADGLALGRRKMSSPSSCAPHDQRSPQESPSPAVVGAKTAYIERGSPWENGYIESFNARCRADSPLADGPSGT